MKMTLFIITAIAFIIISWWVYMADKDYEIKQNNTNDNYGVDNHYPDFGSSKTYSIDEFNCDEHELIMEEKYKEYLEKKEK